MGCVPVRSTSAVPGSHSGGDGSGFYLHLLSVVVCGGAAGGSLRARALRFAFLGSASELTRSTRDGLVSDFRPRKAEA